jgi:hypothetical protein
MHKDGLHAFKNTEYLDSITYTQVQRQSVIDKVPLGTLFPTSFLVEMYRYLHDEYVKDAKNNQAFFSNKYLTTECQSGKSG